MQDLSVLNDTFDLYYKRAKAEHSDGNLALAKRNYLLAAETLMKIAKSSSERLQKAQFDRAKRLVEISENLEVYKSSRRDTAKTAAKENESDDDDEKKQFVATVIPDVSFDDIVGLEDVKRAIKTRVINPAKYPEKYKVYNKKAGGGVLLYGPPGTGKTMIAKAIAYESDSKFYVIKGSDIVSKWVGDSEKNISLLFEQTALDERAIIFIDEMDSLFAARGQDIHNDRRVNEFLQQIDGFSGRNPNMLVLGATNRPWDIDSAALRSGRFSQKIYLPLPDLTARKFLLEMYTKNTPLSSDIDYDELARLTERFSGADIAELCDRAKEEPLEKYIETGEIVKVTQADLLKAINAISPNITDQDLDRYSKY